MLFFFQAPFPSFISPHPKPSLFFCCGDVLERVGLRHWSRPLFRCMQPEELLGRFYVVLFGWYLCFCFWFFLVWTVVFIVDVFVAQLYVFLFCFWKKHTHTFDSSYLSGTRFLHVLDHVNFPLIGEISTSPFLYQIEEFSLASCASSPVGYLLWPSTCLEIISRRCWQISPSLG